MRTMSNNNDDELLLVAAVTWDLQQQHPQEEESSSTSSRRSKVKIYRSDCCSSRDGTDAAVMKGRDLERVIKEQLRLMLLSEGKGEGEEEDFPSELEEEEEPSLIRIEIYDPIQSRYVSLLDEAVLGDEDIIQRFGGTRRLRMTVTYSLVDDDGSNTNADDNNNSTVELPAIMGRYYPYDATEGITIGGKRIIINEITNQENAGTGVNVWDGSLLLARYLEKQPSFVHNKRILELGAGCGLVGIVSGVLGAKDVLMTDLPYALTNMQNNIDSYYKNNNVNNTNNDNTAIPRIVCHPLDWYDCANDNLPTWEQFANIITENYNNHNQTHRNNNNESSSTRTKDIDQEEEEEGESEEWIPDLILVADCVWMQELVEPLLNTIQKLIERAVVANASTKVLISYQRRGKSTHEEFWNGLHNMTNATVSEIDVTTVGLTKPDVLHLLLLEVG